QLDDQNALVPEEQCDLNADYSRCFAEADWSTTLGGGALAITNRTGGLGFRTGSSGSVCITIRAVSATRKTIPCVDVTFTSDGLKLSSVASTYCVSRVLSRLTSAGL